MSDQPRRRRVPREGMSEAAPDLSFDHSGWEDDLSVTLEALSSEPASNWPMRRARLRRSLAEIRLALAAHPKVGRSEVLDDILLLEFALAGLRVGEVHPLVQPGPRGNRLPDSLAKVQFRRVVLQCCEHLIATHIPRKDAYLFVAGLLQQEGFRAPRAKGDEQTAIANLVKRWHQASLPGRSGQYERKEDAYWLDRWASASPAAADPSEARANARRWLAAPLVKALVAKSA